MNRETPELSEKQKATIKMLGLVLAQEKSVIQLLTLIREPIAIFKLKDDDWIKITGLQISYRGIFESTISEDWQRFEDLWNKS